jgi:hypothetical protein
MNRALVHFEVFARKRANAPWSLELATEDRDRAVEIAEQLMSFDRNAAVKVCKEILDPETRLFHSVTVLAKGAAQANPKSRDASADTVHCLTPQDLYTVHARARIGRLLHGWLRRRSVTAFELLHRPDLAEDLDASYSELQHAVQKISIPEAQARGLSTHEVMRGFHALINRAIERVIRDGKTKVFINFADTCFADAVLRLCEQEVERGYLLGGGVAAYLADARTWSEKVGLILDLADQAPQAGGARALALSTLEQPLSEIVASCGGLADLVSAELDLGGSLAALVRLAAAESVRTLIRHDASLEQSLPPLTGPAVRLADWLEREAFDTLRQELLRRVLRELLGPRRLRPGDPDGEIAILRALAMAMTAAAGKLMPLADVQTAFITRSKALVAADFIETYLQGRESALAEAQALVRLAENVAGAVNKTAAGRWISGVVNSLRFENEVRHGSESPAGKLAALAALQRGVAYAGLAQADGADIAARLGALGGRIEADAKLLNQIGKAAAPPLQRLTLLLRLAGGEAAPRGPASERAKAEALKLLRMPETRAGLAGAPETLEQIKALMSKAGLAG